MTKTAISWVLVGVLGYAWWWTGHRWDYLNSPGNSWNSIFIFVTLITLVVLIHRPRAALTGMFGGLSVSIRAILPVLPWIVLAIVTLRAVAWVLFGGAPTEPLDHFVRAIATTLIAGVTTALWYGAVRNTGE